MIEAIFLAIIAVIVTMMLGTAPLLAERTFSDWASFFSAVPFFLVAFAQAIVVGSGNWRRPENAPAIGTLLAVVPFAAFLYEPMSPTGEDTIFLVMAAMVATLLFFCTLIGALFKVAHPLGVVVAWPLAVVAFLLSAVIPSVPPSLAIWQRHPPASYVHDLPSEGELLIEGPPLTVHDVTYQQRKPIYASGYCTIEVTGPTVESGKSFTHPCGTRSIRCDGLRRWCMIDDPNNTEGYTYSGELVTLYGYEFAQTKQERSGNTLLRILAELLAVAAVANLVRSRESQPQDRVVVAVSAILAASVGVAFGIRIML